MRLLGVVAAAFVGFAIGPLAALHAQRGQAEAGFTRLFNGKDLDGWKFLPNTPGETGFVVRDGKLAPETPPRLVVGADPSAVIEGFPGIQGPRVVRPGDVIGQLTVRRIEAARVEVIGMDTTWMLTVRKPWQ